MILQVGLIAAASTTDTTSLKKNFGSSKTALIVSNEENSDVMKIIIFLENAGILIKGVSGTIPNEAK